MAFGGSTEPRRRGRSNADLSSDIGRRGSVVPLDGTKGKNMVHLIVENSNDAVCGEKKVKDGVDGIDEERAVTCKKCLVGEMKFLSTKIKFATISLLECIEQWDNLSKVGR